MRAHAVIFTLCAHWVLRRESGAVVPLQEDNKNKMKQDLLQPKNGWAVPAGARLPVPPAAQRGLMFRTVSQVSRWFGRAQLPNIFPVLNTNGRIFWAWLFFASRLMPYGRLPAATREKIILRVAWNCRSRYEWAQHLELAQKVGVSDAEVLQLTLPVAEIKEPYWAAVYAACDSLCAKEAISDAVWNQLAEEHTDKELIEILVLAGHYEMVAGVLINAKVPLEADIEENFQRFQARCCGDALTTN